MSNYGKFPPSEIQDIPDGGDSAFMLPSRRYRQFSLAAFVKSSMAASAATPRPGEILRDVVQRLTARLVGVLNKQDVEGMLSLYAPDAVLLPPDRPGVRGTDAIRKLLKAMFDAGYSNATLERDSIVHLGDLAVEFGRYTMQIAEKDGRKRQDGGKYVNAWRRQLNGEFQITVSIWSSGPLVRRDEKA